MLEYPSEADMDERDPVDETDRDGGELEDANEDAMDRWAERYDDLNGAPERMTRTADLPIS